MKPPTLFPNHSENLIDRYIPGRSDYYEPHNEFEGSFAQPIEDEDIFNVEPQESAGPKSPKLDDLIEMPSLGDHSPDTFEHDIRLDKRNDIGYSFLQPDEEDEDIVGLSKLNSIHGYEKVDLDKLFVDDYSQSNDSQKLSAKQTSHKSDENKEPTQTPSQIRRMQLLEKIRQQAQSMSLVPKKIGSDLNKDGMIDICVDDGQLVSDSNSKFIFNSLFNKSKKANESYDSGKVCWNQYKQTLQKSICAKKRKIWDSFQKPTDNYDEEEELIEEVESPSTKEGDDGSHQASEADVEIDDGEEIEQVTIEEDDEEPLRRFRRIYDDDENDENGDDEEASNGNLEDLEREDALILDEANHSWSDEDRNTADVKDDSDNDSDNLSILDDSSDDSEA